MEQYLESNRAYWSQGYDALNVDHPVFRFYGRILKPEFNITGNGEKLVDFGCGRGAAVDYWVRAGFNARGCDISQTDLDIAKLRYPLIADRFDLVSPDPTETEVYGFSDEISVFTAIQSLYYFSDTHFEICMDKIFQAMKPGAVFYATMIGENCKEFFDNSEPVDDGLRKVEFENGIGKVEDYYISFIKNEEHLIEKFSMFRMAHVGYYAGKFRSDEGDGFHYVFCGVKP